MSYSLAQDQHHSFAGTALIVPRDMLSALHKLFYMEYDICRGVSTDRSYGDEDFTDLLNYNSDVDYKDTNYKGGDNRNREDNGEGTVSERDVRPAGWGVRDWRCGSDQYLWTLVRGKYPHYFHIMSYQYGDISFLW